MSEGALEDLIVLDLSQGLAGSYCTKWFADLGATVINIEPPERGDALRSLGPFKDDTPNIETSVPHLFLNSGKKSITLALNSRSGRERLLRLVHGADVLVDDSRPVAMDELGLGYAELSAANSGLVYETISPFGLTGPYCDYPATALTISAFSGSLSPRAIAGRQPVNMGCHQGMYLGGRIAFISAMAALLHRHRTGAGQHVDVSLLEAMAGNDIAAPTTYSYTGVAQGPRTGANTLGRGGAGRYRCSDGYVDALPGIGGLKKLAALIGQPELAEHELFTNHAMRSQKAAEFDREFMEPYFSTHTRAEILEVAQDLGMPFSYVLSPDDLLDDKHLAERGFFVNVKQAVAGLTTLPGAPALFSKTPIQIGRAPRLGESNADILAGAIARPASRTAPTTSQPPGGTALSGIRVLDLTRAYAGTIGTLYLADLGADVIKVEAVTRPDIPTREMNPAELDPGEKNWERAAYFHRLNVGKRDITLDLTTDTGKGLFRRLVRHCDVVAENYNPQTMRRFGLHYDALKELNPGIIMVSMSGFGAEGPSKHWAAYAGGMESMSGLVAVSGYENGDTISSQTGYGDWSLGTTGALSVLAALHYRDRTGHGQHIDVSGRDAVLCALGDAIVDHSLNERAWKPAGNSEFNWAPHDTFACTGVDQWVAISVTDQGEWEKFCRVLGSPPWAEDGRFVDQEHRHANREAMRPMIEQWTGNRPKEEASSLLLAGGVPAGPVLSPAETLFDPQLRERGYYEVIEHPLVGRRLFPRQASARYSNMPVASRAHPPLLGEHNHQVLSELLGFSGGEIEELEKAGDIGTEPRRKSRRPPEMTRDAWRKRGAIVDDDYLAKLSAEYGVRIGPKN